MGSVVVLSVVVGGVGKATAAAGLMLCASSPRSPESC